MSTGATFPSSYVQKALHFYLVRELEQSLARVVQNVGQLTDELLQYKMKLREQGLHGLDLYSDNT